LELIFVVDKYHLILYFVFQKNVLFRLFFFLTGVLKEGVFERKKAINRYLCRTLVDGPESAPPLGAALHFYQISP